MSMRARGEDGSTLLGLGYATTTTSTSSGSNKATGGNDDDCNLDEMMKYYWQQCLEYHEEQEELNQQQENDEQILFVTSKRKDDEEENPMPESSLVSPPPPPPPSTIVKDHAVAKEEPLPSSVAVNHTMMQASIDKAKAIVEKFQLSAAPANIIETKRKLEDHPPNYYLMQRRQFYIRERERLEKATLKNFDYVVRRDEQRLEQKLLEIQQSRQLEQQLKEREANKLRRMKLQQTHAAAGIGTKRQRQHTKLMHSNKRQNNNKNNKKKEELSSASIYVSNLPLNTDNDDSSNDNTIIMMLRNLFQSYGNIRKIHQYRNKQTGELKNDALIVYNISNNNKSVEEFVNSICKQLNGCQMPCGTIIKVEPAMSNHENSSHPKNHYGPSCNAARKDIIAKNTAEEAKAQPPKEDGGKSTAPAVEEEEDLDDFFASLT